MSVATKRKHVIKELIDDDYTLCENQVLVKVIGIRGNQLYEIKTANGDQFLVSMPKKFRNTVWIKIGSIVAIELIEEGNKVKGEIVRIFLKHHIKKMRADGNWVSAFDDDLTVEDDHRVSSSSENDSHSDCSD